MPLLRKSTELQMRKIRKEIKNAGGDIADKVAKDEQSLPNSHWIKNPFDHKVVTYEDIYSVGNNQKRKKKNMNKHVKTFEQFEQSEHTMDEAKPYNTPYSINQIPTFYLKLWFNLYKKACEENKIKPRHESFDEIAGNVTAISTIFKHAEQYCKDHEIMLDGSEFMGSTALKEDHNIDMLRVGKQVEINGVKGIINRLDGNTVYVELLSDKGVKIEKFPITKMLKQLSKNNNFKYIDEEKKQ